MRFRWHRAPDVVRLRIRGTRGAARTFPPANNSRQTASRQQRLSASPELARQLPTERAGKVVLSRAQLFSREQRLETCARTLDQLCDVIGCGRVDKIAHASS